MATAAIPILNHFQLAPGYDGGPEGRSQLRAEIAAAVDRGSDRVVIDCSGWEQLDLGVLSTLIRGARMCAERGVEFEVANLPSTLRSNIDALRLGSRLGLSG